jgi:hypothetical protein
MRRSDAIPYVSSVVDDTLNGRSLGEDPHAVIRPDSRLVGWQCGFEPLFVAVHSYIPGCTINDDDAADLARDYLAERGWFSGEPTEPDFIL